MGKHLTTCTTTSIWKTTSKPRRCTSPKAAPTPLQTSTAVQKQEAWCSGTTRLGKLPPRWFPTSTRCSSMLSINSSNNRRRKSRMGLLPSTPTRRRWASLLIRSSTIRAVNRCWILGEQEDRGRMPRSCHQEACQEAWCPWWTWVDLHRDRFITEECSWRQRRRLMSNTTIASPPSRFTLHQICRNSIKIINDYFSFDIFQYAWSPKRYFLVW